MHKEFFWNYPNLDRRKELNLRQYKKELGCNSLLKIQDTFSNEEN